MLTLGIGLALCTTVLTVIDAYLIRTLPYPAAARLYTVQYGGPRDAPPRGLASLDWQSLDDVVEQPVAWDLDMFYMLGGAFPEAAPGAWVTPGFVAGIGVRASLGRGFEAADFRPDGPRIALISHRLWQTRFGRDPAIVGRTFRAFVSDRPDNAETFTIVGVLPPDFWAQFPYTEVLAPLVAPTYPYMVRLREGASPVMVADRITALVRAGNASLPAGWRVTLVSAQDSYVAQLRPVLYAVATAAGLVLLISCANVAVLVLVRANRRRHELAVRMALGASPSKIARLLALEAVVLGAAATAAGVTLGHYATQTIVPVVEAYLQRRVPGGSTMLALDAGLMVTIIAGGLALTVIMALLPLAATSRTPLLPLLTASGRAATESPGPRRTRAIMVGLEVAASLALLAGSALLVESAVRMLRQDLGIRTESVLQGSVTLRLRAYPTLESRVALYDRLLAKLSEVAPGGSVGLTDYWPLQPPRARRVDTDAGMTTSVDLAVIGVTPDYFSTLAIPLVAGRFFTSRDRPGAEPVVIVSESLAARVWPGAAPIGRTLRIPVPAAAGAALVPTAHVVVGVVRDVRQSHADESRLDAYVPLLQRADRFAFLYLYSPLPPADWDVALRAAVAAVDPEIAMGPPRLLQSLLDEQRSPARFLALLLTIFAAFAALLALVGLYGVLAYAARQREREIAVRMALGADPGSVTRLFVRQGGVVLLCGLAAGCAGAIALGWLLESQLYGVRPGEPRVLAATTLAFAGIGLVTMWWPARKAAGIDPAAVLKAE